MNKSNKTFFEEHISLDFVTTEESDEKRNLSFIDSSFHLFSLTPGNDTGLYILQKKKNPRDQDINPFDIFLVHIVATYLVHASLSMVRSSTHGGPESVPSSSTLKLSAFILEIIANARCTSSTPKDGQ